MKKNIITGSLMVMACLLGFLLAEEKNLIKSHGQTFFNTNKTVARIDISEKTTKSQPCFVVKNLEDGKLIPTADWMANFAQRGYVIQEDNISEDLEITATADKCKINFALRGPWELKDKNDKTKGIKELWVEYTKFAINGQDIIKKSTPVWYHKPIHHSVTAQKGNVFIIKVRWQKYDMGNKK